MLLNRNDRFHRVALWLWVLATVEILGLGIVVLLGEPGTAALQLKHVDSLAPISYGQSALDRLGEWLPVIIIAWLGMWAARRRVLENPAEHRLLRWTAVVGLGLAIAGGLPMRWPRPGGCTSTTRPRNCCRTCTAEAACSPDLGTSRCSGSSRCA